MIFKSVNHVDYEAHCRVKVRNFLQARLLLLNIFAPMTQDELYMQRCLDLALLGLGKVAPNPMVGCVIVYNGNIVGEGFHQKYGEAHAEVNAVNSVADKFTHLIPESTLYVNLEPCSHFGKTPPCADMIVRQKIKRVVIGSFDPNPLVAGMGIEILKAGGVEVTTSILEKESDFLNRRFMIFHKLHRPYVILKWAQTSDDFLAPNEPRQVWLTNDESKKLVHQWRSEEQAILVGKRTVEIDDPELNVRHVKGNNPVRITIDRTLSLSPTKKIFRPDTRLFVYNESESSNNGSLNLVKLDFEKSVIEQMLQHLFHQQIQSVIIEGGPATLKQFIDHNTWDEARIFTTEHILKSGKKTPPLSGKVASDEMIGKDRLVTLLNS
ncbi:MAG: ribD 2 [Bacteroidota bacterium]|nr:ribD 2 [Bacteroidota bacterium]